MDTIKLQNKPARKKGQALPIGIAAMLAITMLGLLLFNTNQLTSEKMRLTNTADAAAYSGMVWQARILNFHGYTNRAMVANQVAIAQFVSFMSWSKYLYVTSRQLEMYLGWIPYVGAVTAAFYRIASTINRFLERIIPYAILGLDYVCEGLSWVQEIAHAASIVATTDIVRQVVKQNDPNYTLTTPVSVVSLTANAYKWEYNFTSVHKSNKQLNRKANIIRASRDRWTSNRGWTQKIFNIWPLKVELVKEGEARLISKGNVNDDRRSNLDWEWKAKDTLSAHFALTYWGKKGRFSWGWKTKSWELPIGWGEAFASSTNRDIECTGWWCRSQWAKRNVQAERYADAYDKVNIRDSYNGVRSYREIKDLSNRNRDPRLALALQVKKKGDEGARTSEKINGIGSPTAADDSPTGMGKGMFSMKDKTTTDDYNKGISAVGKAEVYFRRPTKRYNKYTKDNKEEYGNLFNPYWDVHLASPDSERRYAWMLKFGSRALRGLF